MSYLSDMRSANHKNPAPKKVRVSFRPEPLVERRLREAREAGYNVSELINRTLAAGLRRRNAKA